MTRLCPCCSLQKKTYHSNMLLVVCHAPCFLAYATPWGGYIFKLGGLTKCLHCIDAGGHFGCNYFSSEISIGEQDRAKTRFFVPSLLPISAQCCAYLLQEKNMPSQKKSYRPFVSWVTALLKRGDSAQPSVQEVYKGVRLTDKKRTHDIS